MDTNLGLYFLSEMVGTGMLILLGCAVNANVSLKKTYGSASGWIVISWGWGLAVFAGVIVASYSGAQLNPAVSIGLFVLNKITVDQFFIAIAAQLVGAFLGAVVCWLAYKKHFDAEEEPANKLGTFSTGPAIRSYGWNVITEIIGTFVLVFVILAFADYGDVKIGTPGALGPLTALPVALLVVAIGLSLGGSTGYAINPARDLGPRIAHAVLPIKGKGSSNWSYAWVPIVGPLVGGTLAAWASTFLLHLA